MTIAELTEQEATEYATYVISSLTGWRWTWPARTVTERYRAPGASGSAPFTDVVSGGRFVGPRELSGGRPRIHLTGRPVTDVLAVKGPNGAELPFVLSQGFVLAFDRVALASSLRGRDPEIEVTYTYGSEPPAVARRAIAALANELLLNSADEACRLPERVTNVTRQGMSWTVIDPQDFLDQGRTGIYEVDLALSVLNRGNAKARARVFSPEFPPPRRITSDAADDDYTLRIQAGTTYERQFRRLKADLSPFDLSDYVARIQIKLGPAYPAVIDIDHMPIDLVTARVSLSIPPEQTSLLTSRRYVYSIELTHTPTGRVDPFVNGSVVVTPEIVV